MKIRCSKKPRDNLRHFIKTLLNIFIVESLRTATADCIKYRNFLLWTFCGYTQFSHQEISTPGNYVKLRCFMQCKGHCDVISLGRITLCHSQRDSW